MRTTTGENITSRQPIDYRDRRPLHAAEIPFEVGLTEHIIHRHIFFYKALTLGRGASS